MARLSFDHRGACVCYASVRVVGPRIHERDVHRACRAVQGKHAVLRCKLVEKNGNFALREDKDVRIPVILRDRREGSMDFYDREVNGKRASEYPLRVVLFRDGTEREQDLGFVMNHFMGDGPSMMLLVHQVLDHLFEGFKYFPAPPRVKEFAKTMDCAVDETIEKTMTVMEFYGKVVRFVGHIVYQIYTPGWVAFKTHADAGVNGNDPTAMHFVERFSVEESAKIVAACKTKNVSVTSFIMACFFQGVAALYPEKQEPYSVMCSCVSSTRDHVEPPIAADDLSMHTASFLVKSKPLNWKLAPDLWSVAQNCKKKIAVGNQEDWQMINAWWTRHGTKLLPTDFGQLAFYLTSFGQNSPVKEYYGGKKYRVLNGEFCQCTNAQPNPLVLIYTYANRLHISISAPRRLCREKETLECLRVAVAQIRQVGLSQTSSKL